MRVRTQLRFVAVLSVLLVLAVGAGTWLAVVAADRAEVEQDRTRTAARHAVALLLLTQEYPRYFEPRVAQQWRERQIALVGELQGGYPGIDQMRLAAERLPVLFDQLDELPDAPETPFTARRTAFLVDQLINETQGVTDGIYRWSRDAAAHQQTTARQFRAIGAVSLVALLALVVGQTIVIVRRLLRPLQRIESAVARVQHGDLSAKVGLAGDDELAQLSRQFDAMTDSLHERRAAVQAEMSRRVLTERRLTDLTDTIPALVGYFDVDERLRYANGPAQRAFDLDPTRLEDYTMRTAIGEAQYRQHLPHLPAVRDGRTVVVDTSSVTRSGRPVHYQAHLVPVKQEDGEVKGFYAMSFDITALKEAEARMSQLAREDTLTGLPNRRKFEERLAEALARSRRTRRPMALMYLDIDHFKTINDSVGHQGGDVVLQEFARRLRASVRVTDMVARLAGDEFVVVLEGLNVGVESEGVAQKIIDSMRPPIAVAGHDGIVVTTSIGIVVSGSEDADITVLTARADEALYRAKRAGRNRFAMSAF